MKGKRVFVDSNIWIYLYSTDAKALIARKTIDKHFKNIILSTQVIGEVFHSLSRKGIRSKDEARTIINDLIESFTVVDVTASIATRAMDTSIRYGFTYWDSLIISTALEHDCTILFTEDLHNGQILEKRLAITNPLL
ncbi:MAG: PIN domain-containing protein [Steroidobacteraceae bacterium]|nr:PIN domain-containing protein [Deltaproteobacteria bacterium]